MLVHHDVYGVGRITDVSGQGVLRKLKIRFSSGRTQIPGSEGEAGDCAKELSRYNNLVLPFHLTRNFP